MDTIDVEPGLYRSFQPISHVVWVVFFLQLYRAVAIIDVDVIQDNIE